MKGRAVRKAVLSLCSAALVSACSANFQEQHYFKSASGENYYRLRVKGKVRMSKARYLTGYYDERALDLFFNELKTTGQTSEQESRIQRLFEPNQILPGTDEKLVPLVEGGAFVLILSSNASSVADAIGQFAENQVVGDSLAQLLNRDLIVDSREKKATFELEQTPAAASTSQELSSLLASLCSSATTGDMCGNEALHALNLIAGALRSTQTFTDADQAAIWIRDALSEGR